MLTALFELLAAIFKPISRLWLGKIQRDETPEAQLERRREQFHENLFKGDSVAESVRVDDLVREIANKNHPNGQNDSNRKAG